MLGSERPHLRMLTLRTRRTVATFSAALEPEIIMFERMCWQNCQNGRQATEIIRDANTVQRQNGKQTTTETDGTAVLSCHSPAGGKAEKPEKPEKPEKSEEPGKGKGKGKAGKGKGKVKGKGKDHDAQSTDRAEAKSAGRLSHRPPSEGGRVRLDTLIELKFVNSSCSSLMILLLKLDIIINRAI